MGKFLSPGIETCKRFFGFDDKDVEKISGAQGYRFLTYLWEAGQLYESGWNILRQECWQHSNMSNMQGYMSRHYVPGKHILDIGCGAAEYLRKQILAGERVCLYDTSERVIDYLRYKWGNFSNVEIYKSLGGVYGIDVWICLDVLEHIRDPLNATCGFMAATKPVSDAFIYFNRQWPHPGHLLESIDAYEKWYDLIRDHFDVIENNKGVMWLRRRS